MQLESKDDLMRGVRVEAQDESLIKLIAGVAAKSLVINRRTKKKMDVFMEKLGGYGIDIDVISDQEWLDVTNAACLSNTILMPESLYFRICEGEPEAIFILGLS